MEVFRSQNFFSFLFFFKSSYRLPKPHHKSLPFQSLVFLFCVGHFQSRFSTCIVMHCHAHLRHLNAALFFCFACDFLDLAVVCFNISLVSFLFFFLFRSHWHDPKRRERKKKKKKTWFSVYHQLLRSLSIYIKPTFFSFPPSFPFLELFSIFFSFFLLLRLCHIRFYTYIS